MAVHCCGSSFWLYLLISVGLVLFAGMMSGLTLGLMSLSLVDLEVLMKSGTEKDRRYAAFEVHSIYCISELGLVAITLDSQESTIKACILASSFAKILPVVKNRHLLLCTLLIGNALAMEALPIFLDELINAWGAVLISVTLILMFGEILPQAVCSRYGLAVGAAMTPVVQLLVILFFPVTYPISKLLDFMLGKSHLALFRRAELMTLVNMHGNEAGKGGELTHDETTIITGALEMTQKTAQDAMMPILTIFSIDVNATLDMDMMNLIMMKGHSRIPVYSGTPTNIIGLVLVKNLLTTRPEDKLLVRQHATIRKIPRVEASMPLYDILNEFQKGHSHMAAVIRRSQVKMDSKRKEITSHAEKRMDSSRYDGNRAQGLFMAITLDIPEVENVIDPRNIRSIKQNPLDVSNLSSFSKDEGRILENFSQRSRKWDDDLLEISETFIPSFPSDEEVIGIITMEDVIEELLQEEILDETDEYIDVKDKIKVNMVPQLSPFSSSVQTGSAMSPISSSDQHDISSVPSPIASAQTTTELVEAPLSLQVPILPPTWGASSNVSVLQSPLVITLSSNQRQTGEDTMRKSSGEQVGSYSCRQDAADDGDARLG